MNKQEFLEKLRMALSGKVSPSVVAENVNYYEDYINVEIRKGRTEEEVLNELGDPRLIARTIVSTSGNVSDGYYRQAGSEDYRTSGGSNRSLRVPGWVFLIVILVVVVLVLGMVFSVLTYLLPILLPILVVLFLVKLFRDWMN